MLRAFHHQHAAGRDYLANGMDTNVLQLAREVASVPGLPEQIADYLLL
jgi:hypothetical protein